MKLISGMVLSMALIAALVGCASNTATPSTPAPVQVATFSKTLADALNAANQSVMAFRNAGSITQAETVQIQNIILLAAGAGKAMDAELNSADPWATQKTKIIQIWTSAGITAASAHLSPTAAASLNAVVVVVNEIMTALGGPQL